MAVSGSVTGRATLPSPSNAISVALGGTISVVVQELDSPDEVYIAIGDVTPGPPATYADIGADYGSAVATWVGDFQARRNALTGKYAITLTKVLDGSAMAPGDSVWVALFLGGPYGGAIPGSTVPDVLLGPLDVIA